MTALTVFIFLFTYLLIAARELAVLPIGRPAGALVGAVLMIAVGAISPRESFAAIDHDTILLLFGMMLLSVYVEDAGLFEWIARRTLVRCTRPMSLLAVVSLLSGVLSAVLVNDAVCVFLTPIVVNACRRARLPLGPYLIALATSANIGSAATLVGNPQNMMIGSMSGLSFAEFLALSGPAAAAGLAVNLVLLWLFYGRRLSGPMEAVSVPAPPPGTLGPAVVGGTALGVVAGFFAGWHLGYTVLAGVVVLILIDRRNPRAAFARVDWPLLVFFCCLFIVVEALVQTGLVQRVWTLARPHMGLADAGGLALFAAVVTAGSNLVSNVPMTLLTGPHVPALGPAKLGFAALAFASTVAGNLTLVGSVANIIVAERSRDHYRLGYVEYLRFGLVSTPLVLAAGLPVVRLAARWWG